MKPIRSNTVRNCHLLKQAEAKLKDRIPLRLTEAIERGYQERWKYCRSGDTTRLRLRVIVRIIGNIPLEYINRDHIQRAIAALQESGRSLATINRHLAHLKTLLNMAAEDWKVQFLDRPRIRLFRVTEPRKRIVSREEEERILRTLREGQHWHPRVNELRLALADLIEVLVRSGMRLSEALSLRYDRNIDFETETLHLFGDITKSARPRSIPMHPKVRELLTQRKEWYPDRPFPYSKEVIVRFFHRFREALGYTEDNKIGLHAFRHTFASRLIDAGEDIMVIKDLLGHSSIAVTQIYLHLSIGRLRQAVNRIS